MTKSDVKFCEAVSEGQLGLQECLMKAYPEYKKKSKRAREGQANRLVRRKDIQEKVMELQREFAEKVKPSNEQLKQEMVDRLLKGIRTGTDGDPLTIVEFVPAIKQLSTMLGWDAPKDVTLRNGGFAADYKGPPTLMTMTDEEISARLREIRGE